LDFKHLYTYAPPNIATRFNKPFIIDRVLVSQTQHPEANENGINISELKD